MADTEFKTLIDETQRAVKELRDKADEAQSVAELRGGELLSEHKSFMGKVNDRIDQIETRLNRPAAGGAPERKIDGSAIDYKDALGRYEQKGPVGLHTEEMKALHKAVFEKWARQGDEGMLVPERKVLTVGDDTTGGYLASSEMSADIVKGIIEFSPVRELAKVRKTSKKSYKQRTRTGTFAAAWASEIGTRTESTGLAYGLKEMPVHELYAYVKISRDDLEDPDFNMEDELQSESSEQFGVAEGTAFISGSGVGKPQGILNGADVGTTNSGHATQLTGDGFVRMYHAIKTPYANRGTWLANRLTLREIRILKDGTGNYIWRPSLADGSPPALLERPYREATDLVAPSSGATYVASGKPVIFGDLKRAYQIVDRSMMSVIRDIYTAKSTGQVEFMFTRRLDGQVVLAEAVQVLVISA